MNEERRTIIIDQNASHTAVIFTVVIYIILVRLYNFDRKKSQNFLYVV